MNVFAVEAIMRGHCYKKVFTIIGVLITLAVVFKTSDFSQVGTTRPNIHTLPERKVDEVVPEKNSEKKTEIESVDKVKPSEKWLRQPTFNISFLRNQCQSSKTKTLNLEFDLRVFVFTYNRAASVKRLLVSLNKAEYGNSSVAIEVWVDKPVDGKTDARTLKLLNEFKFDHGVYRVCVHENHVGILGQWLIPWKPKENSKEIAVLLEDDMTVSPYFFRYLKIVHSKYRDMPKVNGFALQGISMKHNGEGGLVNIPPMEKVYLYPTLGTWGYSPKTENWIKFLRWFEGAYSDRAFVPSVPGHVGTGWYQGFLRNKKEDGFWEMWYICNAWMQKEWTLYPTFPGHRGLTFNWKENGLHYNGQAVTNAEEDKKHLLLEWKSEFESLPEVPVYVDNGGHILPPFNV